MKLDDHNPQFIELLAFGLHDPAPSITQQLARLLRKKLISISMDALSSVLKKNPYYQRIPADMIFT